MPVDKSVTEYPKWDYREYPKTLPRDDFWGQVRRTVMGQRISEDQVALLADHVRALLAMKPNDFLLDLGCGNGALSATLFAACSGFMGVDPSDYLIGVAKEFFERTPTHVFANGDALEFVTTTPHPDRYTHCLCYAALQYLKSDTVPTVLKQLHNRFPNLVRVVIGNLPDRERAAVFFKNGYQPEELDEPQSQIGRWWSKDEFSSLASDAGWSVTVTDVPPHLFNVAYRFDSVLTRAEHRSD